MKKKLTSMSGTEDHEPRSWWSNSSCLVSDHISLSRWEMYSSTAGPCHWAAPCNLQSSETQIKGKFCRKNCRCYLGFGLIKVTVNKKRKSNQDFCERAIWDYFIQFDLYQNLHVTCWLRVSLAWSETGADRRPPDSSYQEGGEAGWERGGPSSPSCEEEWSALCW